MRKIMTSILLAFISFFLLGLIYIKFCVFLSDTTQYEFMAFWLRGLLLIIIIGTAKLYAVKTDQYDKTGYKNGYTPQKAAFGVINHILVSVAMFYSAIFYNAIGISNHPITKETILPIISYKTGLDEKMKLETDHEKNYHDSNNDSSMQLRYRD